MKQPKRSDLQLGMAYAITFSQKPCICAVHAVTSCSLTADKAVTAENRV